MKNFRIEANPSKHQRDKMNAHVNVNQFWCPDTSNDISFYGELTDQKSNTLSLHFTRLG